MPVIGWIDGAKRASAVRKVGLQEGTHLAMEECMERICETVIVQAQSNEARHLRVIGCLY